MQPSLNQVDPNTGCQLSHFIGAGCVLRGCVLSGFLEKQASTHDQGTNTKGGRAKGEKEKHVEGRERRESDSPEKRIRFCGPPEFSE